METPVRQEADALMIERIVLIKLVDEEIRRRPEIAEYSRDVLRLIPGVGDVHVGLPADEPSAAAWDLALVLRFRSLDDVEAYRVHPDHRAYVDSYLKPRMVAITAWNFEV